MSFVNSKQTNQRRIKKDKIEFKRLAKATLYNSAAQSIIKLAETPFVSLKTFLSMCVLTSSCACGFLIIELIVDYLSFRVSTTTRTLYETPALFPKVTICNVNPFTTEYATSFLSRINKDLNYTIDIFDKIQMKPLSFYNKSKIIANVYYQAIFKMNSLNETEKKKLSHSFENLVHNCYFNAQPCSKSDFKWYFDPFYGNCWQFNSGFNGITNERVQLGYNSFPGEFYGLSLIFYVNFHKNLTTFNSYNGGGLGAVIRIDNSSYLTSYIGSDGIKIKPGLKTSIAVSRSFKSRLPIPYSNCLINNQTTTKFESHLFNLILNSAYRYTQPICFLQCLQRAILLECNCVDPSIISLLPNKKQCLSPNETRCMIYLYDVKLYKNNFVHDNCLSECPLECYLEKFDVSLSSVEYLSEYYMDYLNTNSQWRKEFYKKTSMKSFINLNIFYKTLSYDLSTESPKTDLIWLFASIGGYLGLFLGVSVFSLFEPIVVLIEVLLIKFATKKTTKETGLMSQSCSKTKLNYCQNKEESLYDRVSVI